MVEPCRGVDIQVHWKKISELSVRLQGIIVAETGGLEPRDQMIITAAVENILVHASEKAIRASAGQAFLRSVRESLNVARKFGFPGEK